MLGSIYAMVGVAMTLSIGILRFLNFSIPALFMIGGMVTWALVHAGVPWPVAVLAACGGCRGRAHRRGFHLALDERGGTVRSARQFDGFLDPV
jgi:branched-subunit amino acid ABC-type transport system permease component